MRGQAEPGGERRRVELPRIPGYLIEGVLGSGGSGVVYRARQRSVDRLVALKVLHPSATRKESTVKRLRREARLMAMLDHPNIVSAFDVGESANGWWLAMELVEGPSLLERLRRGGPLSEEEAISLFIPLADALQHAHEAGVIHRDVKPANVILSPSGEPRLVDLGLARSDDELQLTRVGATMGTPHYVSPEQARNPASVDARSDVYSIAATLHHSLCGEPPFPGESQAEVIASVLHGTLRDPHELYSGVSQSMSLVLRKALSKDPARRHASARDLAVDLRLLAEGKKPRVRAAQLEPVEGRGAMKGRYLVAGALLFVLGAALIIRGLDTKVSAPEIVAVQTEFDRFEERWGGGELMLAEAIATHAFLMTGPREHDRHERLGRELDRALESLLFDLRSKVDRSRPALLLDRRFDAARSALGDEFDEALMSSAGLTASELPGGRLEATERWRARGHAEIEAELGIAHRECASALRRWFEQTLWPRVEEHMRAGEFDAAARLLDVELIEHVGEAGVLTDGLDLEHLAGSTGLKTSRETQVKLRYDLDSAWRRLDDGLLSAVRRAVEGASDRLKRGEVQVACDELYAWASGRFREANLDLSAMPTRFTSRAADEFEFRLSELKSLETRMRLERELGTMARLDTESQALLLERRYAELIEWWSEAQNAGDPALSKFFDSRIAEARLLAELLDDARAKVIRGVEEKICFSEGGSSFQSDVQLVGDPVYEVFWVTIAPGTEIAWRLGGPPEVVGGVRRVSTMNLIKLSGRVAPSATDICGKVVPCLEVAFLRLAEGDIAGADECYRELEVGATPSTLVDELVARLGPLLAAASLSEAERREWASRWVDSRDLSRLMEGHRSKATRLVESFLRDYGSALDEERLKKVRSWGDALAKEFTSSTVKEFEEKFGADTVSFPRRGRVELTQRFDGQLEGAWDAGDWIALGLGWQAPLQAGVEQVISNKVPTLLLRDPFDLRAGPVEVEFDVKVPEDARARLVVMSALGFHCAFVTGDGEEGLVVAGSRDLEGVIERALSGEGEEFPGLHPGESHRVTLRANQARGTMSVLFDGEECVRIADLSPKDRPRSTSVSLRSLEPLLLIGARIEAGRR